MNFAADAVLTTEENRIGSGQSFLRRINIVLTARGIIILIFLCYLLYSPILKETDIIAAVIAGAGAAVIALLFSLCLFHGVRLKKTLAVDILPPRPQVSAYDDRNSDILSGTENIFVIKTSRVRLFPGFILTIQIEFDPGLQPYLHYLSGSSEEDRILVQTVTFPHRGNWHLKRVGFSVGDRLGFTGYSWELPEEKRDSFFRIAPFVDSESPLPVISSSNSAGDTLPDIREKTGDPFDLKSYHPADGMKKILWKVYAKSGELISRHPEASMTPEGQVVIFCMADKNEDGVCSAALSYINAMEHLNLEVFFYCEAAGRNKIARSLKEAKDLLINSVWDTEDSSPESIRINVHSLVQQFKAVSGQAELRKILIFCGRDRISGQEGFDAGLKLAHYLQPLEINPVFIINSGARPVSEEDFIERLGPGHDGKKSFLNKMFFNPSDIKQKPRDNALYSRFLSICASYNWQVIV